MRNTGLPTTAHAFLCVKAQGVVMGLLELPGNQTITGITYWKGDVLLKTQLLQTAVARHGFHN